MDVTRSLIAIFLALAISGHADAGVYDGTKAYLAADFATALKEFTPEVKKGDPVAQFYLGRMYQGGLGVPKDVPRGVALLGQAANNGNSDAQYYYGIALALGEGGRKDLTEGLKWLYISARMGNEDAEKHLRKLRMPRELALEAQIAASKWHREFQKKHKGTP